MDRAPEEILSAPEDDSSWWDKLLPFLPGGGIAKGLGDYLSPDDIYQDPIMRNIPDNILGAGSEISNLENFDYYHYRRNGYSHEEALEILNEQGLA